MDGEHGFIFSTDLTPTSVSDSIYRPYALRQLHTGYPIGKIHADKGYYGKTPQGLPQHELYCRWHHEEGYQVNETDRL